VANGHQSSAGAKQWQRDHFYGPPDASRLQRILQGHPPVNDLLVTINAATE
jgi:hypothetical protein